MSRILSLIALAPGGNVDLMKISRSVVKAGPVTFVISNQSGGNKKIDGIVQGAVLAPFVLLKTNTAPSKLPVGSNGQQLEQPRVGKRIVVEPGKTATITLSLKPGRYVVLGAYGALGKAAALRVTS